MFSGGEMKLIPIVYSHGLTGSRTSYTSVCQELASHGYIVFALDHHDGSCPYTEDFSGDKYWCFDTRAPSLDVKGEDCYEDFHQKVITRETEVRYLLDDITHPAFNKKALKFPHGVTYDFDKLTVAGHSFGGATALKVA
jgi:platelet-activating factor acetylhydrolase